MSDPYRESVSATPMPLYCSWVASAGLGKAVSPGSVYIGVKVLVWMWTTGTFVVSEVTLESLTGMSHQHITKAKHELLPEVFQENGPGKWTSKAIKDEFDARVRFRVASARGGSKSKRGPDRNLPIVPKQPTFAFDELLPDLEGNDNMTPEQLRCLWNEITQKPRFEGDTIPFAKSMRFGEESPKRAKCLRRIEEHDSIAFWTSVIEQIRTSLFCRGLGETGWIANFDWLIRNSDICVSLLEGKYHWMNDRQDAMNTKEADGRWKPPTTEGL